MSETAHLDLPLLAAAQAQKHVTVNEALARLDALVSLSVISRSLASPPASPADGARYIVPPAATDEWAGRDGQVAIAMNGGWEFATPSTGWRAWIADENTGAVHDGFGWFAGLVGAGAFGAGTAMRLAMLDHSVSSGSNSTTGQFIPDKALIFGVTARVLQTITGNGISSWKLGVIGSQDRYGTDYGLDANSFAHGQTSEPLTYFGPTELKMKPNAGTFTGGQVRFAVHYLSLTPPAAI